MMAEKVFIITYVARDGKSTFKFSHRFTYHNKSSGHTRAISYFFCMLAAVISSAQRHEIAGNN